MQAAALVFDLDGVLLRTTMAKHDAMLAVLAPVTSDAEAVSRAILRRGGVPRRIKLPEVHIEATGRELSTAELNAALSRYEALLSERLAAAPLIPGARSFVLAATQPRYVCSSAPAAEIHAQLERRGLLGCFAAVFAGDTPKAQALGQLARRHGGATTVFFGDALPDWQAAQRAGTAFVGVTAERDAFDLVDAQTIEDFLVPSAVVAALASAIERASQRRH